jgi:hypothetical protein
MLGAVIVSTDEIDKRVSAPAWYLCRLRERPEGGSAARVDWKRRHASYSLLAGLRLSSTCSHRVLN